MPRVFVGFIKAGRMCIPVELYFIYSTDNDGQHNITSSHWADTHWNNIKDMLRPTVELGIKYSNETNNIWESSPGCPRIAYKDDLVLGYVFVPNKNKFTDLLDLRPSFIDVQDDETLLDEHSGLKDFGGQFKRYPPTKVYIKACAFLRSGHGSDHEDEKKIRKELGLKVDSYRNFFQPLSLKNETQASFSLSPHSS